MNRTAVLGIVFVVVLAAVIYFGLGTAEAAEQVQPKPLPKPEPLFKPLAPEDYKTATVQTSHGPLELVQKWDTSGFNALTKPVATVPVQRAASIKPGFISSVTRL